MISAGVIGSFFRLALVLVSAQRDDGNQAISPTQAPVATLAPMDACNGPVDWIGDGFCNEDNNNEDCGFDGGDCCECTCTDGESSNCDDNISFSCRDPSASCFDGYDQDDADASLDAENSGFRFSPWILWLLLVIFICGIRVSYSYPYWTGNSEWGSDPTSSFNGYTAQNSRNVLEASRPRYHTQPTGGQQPGVPPSYVSDIPPAQ